jgi:hypothetical protein
VGCVRVDDGMSIERSVVRRSQTEIWSSSSPYLPFQSCSLMGGQGGDDLEDDYVPDELVATSGDEEEYSHHGSSNGDLSLDDALKPSGSTAHPETERSNKRKRSEGGKQRRLKAGHLNQTSRLPETQYERAEA